jgi:outer membrane protein, heavy metal efflux system
LLAVLFVKGRFDQDRIYYTLPLVVFCPVNLLCGDSFHTRLCYVSEFNPNPRKQDDDPWRWGNLSFGVEGFLSRTHVQHGATTACHQNRRQPGWSLMLFFVLALLAIQTQTACIHYQARPLEPPRSEAQFRSRSLNDAGLQEFVRADVGAKVVQWPPKSLNLELLTSIAFYYSPDLETARAEMAVAAAGIRAAQARINPSLSVEGGYNANPEAHTLFGVLPTFTIETAGKRGHRIFLAERDAEIARLTFEETAWRVRSRVRTALMDWLFARLKSDLLKSEVSIRSEIVEIFDLRLALGEASRPEVEVFRVDLISAQAALKTLEGELAQNLAVLASACGLPLSALEGYDFDAPKLEFPPPLESLPLQNVLRAGLLNRADVRRSLVEYASAEAALRLEIARQYPDIELSPSFSFEEGFARYVLGATLGSIPVFHRNQGPIAVAEAQRLQVEARFNALQADVIGEMDKALVQYRAALSEMSDAASRLMAVQKEREDAVRRVLAAGQGDRLDLALARLESVAALRVRQEALIRAQMALGALEGAAQYPLESGQPLKYPPQTSPIKGAIR